MTIGARTRISCAFIGLIVIFAGAVFMLALRAQAAPASNPPASPGDKNPAVAAKADLSQLETAIDAYVVDNNGYPTSQDGLNALIKALASASHWHGPYIKSLPQDPWQHPYHYLNPGKRHTHGYDVWSTGPDGIDGTDDDISN